jgi:DNA-binding PadR family transcriptional regulator
MENKVNDWVGRCIAESKTSVASHAITLTYGRDENGEEHHPRAKVLTYSDVQKYLKRLKSNGFPHKFFCVGEYGSKKGRAHWHIILFWKGKGPPHELDKEGWHERHWPHGTSHWTTGNASAFRYNTKYIQKDIGKMERQGHLMMSKKPPLGTAYFHQLAEQHVEQGIAPISREYSFDDARNRRGQKVKFYLKGATYNRYISHFIRTWKEKRPDQHIPNSELVESWLDKQAAEEMEPLEWREKMAARQVVTYEMSPPGQNELKEWMKIERVTWDPKLKLYFYPLSNNNRKYWDGHKWRRKIAATGEKARDLSAQIIREYQRAKAVGDVTY